MTTFVDTSAILALLDADDPNHRRATETFEGPLRPETLVTHNYVVVETTALTHHRFGPEAVRDLAGRILPRLEIAWIDRVTHDAAFSALIGSSRRRPSVVDLVTFEYMRRNRVETAFAFDKDFREQGFRTIP